MDEQWFSKRLSALRAMKNVSAREMSLALGQNASYINRIENGWAYPSMQCFFYICEYLGVTPAEFFDESTQTPELIQKAIEGMRQLSERDIIMLLGFIDRLKRG